MKVLGVCVYFLEYIYVLFTTRVGLRVFLSVSQMKAQDDDGSKDATAGHTGLLMHSLLWLARH